MNYLWTKENATALVRTSATYLYAWLATVLPGISDFVADIGLDPAGFILLVGTALYQAVRLAAEKWSWVGYVLIINQKPVYQPVPEPVYPEA